MCRLCHAKPKEMDGKRMDQFDMSGPINGSLGFAWYVVLRLGFGSSLSLLCLSHHSMIFYVTVTFMFIHIGA